MEGILKDAGLEEKKVCSRTKVVRGCGKEKPLSAFPKTKHGHQAVCKECLSVFRKKRAKTTSGEEAELYNKLSEIWR